MFITFCQLSRYSGINRKSFKFSSQIGKIQIRQKLLDSLLSSLMHMNLSERRDLIENVNVILDFVPVPIRDADNYPMVPD